MLKCQIKGKMSNVHFIQLLRYILCTRYYPYHFVEWFGFYIKTKFECSHSNWNWVILSKQMTNKWITAPIFMKRTWSIHVTNMLTHYTFLFRRTFYEVKQIVLLAWCPIIYQDGKGWNELQFGNIRSEHVKRKCAYNSISILFISSFKYTL